MEEFNSNFKDQESNYSSIAELDEMDNFEDVIYTTETVWTDDFDDQYYAVATPTSMSSSNSAHVSQSVPNILDDSKVNLSHKDDVDQSAMSTSSDELTKVNPTVKDSIDELLLQKNNHLPTINQSNCSQSPLNWINEEKPQPETKLNIKSSEILSTNLTTKPILQDTFLSNHEICNKLSSYSDTDFTESTILNWFKEDKLKQEVHADIKSNVSEFLKSNSTFQPIKQEAFSSFEVNSKSSSNSDTNLSQSPVVNWVKEEKVTPKFNGETKSTYISNVLNPSMTTKPIKQDIFSNNESHCKPSFNSELPLSFTVSPNILDCENEAELTSYKELSQPVNAPSSEISDDSVSNASKSSLNQKNLADLPSTESQQSKKDKSQLEINENEEIEKSTTQPQVFTRRFLKHQVPESTLQPLPEGWSIVRHVIGIPCYYHQQSGVITWSRPYISETFDYRILKKHNVPIQSIPCLNYLKTKEMIETHLNANSQPSEANNATHPVIDSNSDTCPVKKENENKEDLGDLTSNIPKAILHNSGFQTLEENEFIKYLEKRFEFYEKEITRFTSWSERRKNMRKEVREAKKKEQNPAITAKVVTLSIPKRSSNDRAHKMSFNLSNKTMICILHEYVQHALKTKPAYSFSVKEGAVDPFHVVVTLNGKDYASGSGVSKKAAKNRAALETMEVLVPGFKEKVDIVLKADESGNNAVNSLDSCAVDDPRIIELCIHSGDFLPYDLLSECLKRNQPIVNVQDKFEVKPGRGKAIEYKMECGKHTVTGIAKNKREGKQIAAQKILQLMHPQVKTWGELSKLYGSEVSMSFKRKRALEQEILELKQRDVSSRYSNESAKPKDNDSKPRDQPSESNDDGRFRRTERRRDVLVPNPELLTKLREMMLNLGKERREEAERKIKTGIKGEPVTKRMKLHVIDV